VSCIDAEAGRAVNNSSSFLSLFSAKTLIYGAKLTAADKLNTVFLHESPLLRCCPTVINEHGLFRSLASLPFTVLNMLR